MPWSLLWWACDGQAGKSFLPPLFSPVEAGVPQGKRGGRVPVQLSPDVQQFFLGHMEADWHSLSSQVSPESKLS